MTLAATFEDLRAQLGTLRERLIELHTTVVEDRPLQGDVVLVERFGNAIDDVRGHLEEALAAAREGRLAFEGQTDLEAARRALTSCHEQFGQLFSRFASDLFSYERLVALGQIGRERGREWRAWASVVGSTLDRCQQHIVQVSQSLSRCWHEVAERSATMSISVKTSNVGQQFLAGEEHPRARETAI